MIHWNLHSFHVRKYCSVLLFGLTTALASLAATQSDALDLSCETLLQKGDEFRLAGKLTQAIESLKEAYARAGTSDEKGRAAAALGTALLQQHRLADALPLLEEAVSSGAPNDIRALAANDLGNLLALVSRTDDAERAYAQAISFSPRHIGLMLAVEFNRLRLPGATRRSERLNSLLLRIDELTDRRERARYSLFIASEAKSLGNMALTYQALDKARESAGEAVAPRLQAEALDGLAQLYEDQKQQDDAMRLNRFGIQQAQAADARELLIGLEWRQARIWQALGNRNAAIAALRNAVTHIEAVRQNIPVTYQNGRSSFRDTLAPIYQTLTDLLLQQTATQKGTTRAATMRQARDITELAKQSELEDYLGNRCSVGVARQASSNVRGGTSASLPRGAAVLYPIILSDRIELLIETEQGMEQVTVKANPMQFDKTVREFLYRLSDDRLSPDVAGQQLYQWLIAPLEMQLKQLQTDTLVIVPDSILRRVPFAALHDGTDYLIRRYAVAIAPGLSLVHRSSGPRKGLNVLLAGMSEPGSVLDKLTPSLLKVIMHSGEEVAGMRSVSAKGAMRRSIAVGSSVISEDDSARRDALKASLRLPGVKEEVDQINRITGGDLLLDDTFTLDNLIRYINTGDYQVIHLATHGVFGPTADTTFVMTHDDLLTLDRLQQLVRKHSTGYERIDLLTLSACQTAQGDDRAPLGLAGAAIQARAGAALGSLWPVSDGAASRLMSDFYTQLARTGNKARALRESQLSLLEEREFKHPYFWAPFIIVGDWQ